MKSPNVALYTLYVILQPATKKADDQVSMELGEKCGALMILWIKGLLHQRHIPSTPMLVLFLGSYAVQDFRLRDGKEKWSPLGIR